MSVLFAIADEPVAGELVRAHEAAVRAAVGWIEDTSVQVRRGAQGHFVLPGEGLIAAAYVHRMSRALDPQLHTHVVAANLTRGPDGRFTALNGTPLYRSAKTAGYLYQAHLRAEISDRLGLEWGPVSKGAAELKDVPRGALEEFSRRRQEMEQAAAEGGFSLESKRSAEAAAVDTRERKRYGIETHTWREEIQARAAEHGLGRDEIAELLARGRNRVDPISPGCGPSSASALSAGGDEHELEVLAARLAGEHGLTERSNTFDQRAVLQEFAAAAVQGARVAKVRDRADWFVDRGEVLRTRSEAMTTQDLVGCERRLIDSALGRIDAGCAVVAESEVARALASADRRLTDEQAEVVRLTASSGHGVQVVEALAGTGKTYTAGVLRSLYEAAGYRVVGLAPTGRGARELTEDAGIPACTIDRALLDIEQLGGSFPEGCVVVLDEAGMAPTRPTARLLEHAASVGAKVIAIGDSGQLPSVLAGGWLRAVSERAGALRLSDVIRQRNPSERRALAALHDRVPARYMDWARAHGRIDVVAPDRVIETAVREWIAAASEHGPEQVVMIARDNETRARLNHAARAHRADAGELGEERNFGATPVAVGDRVICRDNDARVQVDNGTRGTVRHVTRAGVVLEIDAGAVRELPAGYVADHVEHAYCLTGHGMQGGTVERAFVVASPEDLTAGWSYSALSRARGETHLLVADLDRRGAERAEVAPLEARPTTGRSDVLAKVARRMLVRDDEDLAADQIPAAGREDDPALASHRAADGTPPQEVAADRAQATEPVASVSRLIDLREQISRHRLVFSALPTRPLARFDELDTTERQLAIEHEEHTDRLAALDPPTRRLGRVRDPNADERAFLVTALELNERALSEVRVERTRLRRELRDPDQVRSEREGIEAAIDQLQHDYDRVRDVLADRLLDRRPRWLTEALGDRPEHDRESKTWDRAARAIAAFRLDHEVSDSRTALGPEPSLGDARRHEWDETNALIERTQRQLGHQPPACEHRLDLGIG